MRNAAATMDDDFGYETAPRKAAPRKASGRPRSGGNAGKAKKGTKRRGVDMHRVARIAAIGMAATMATGIMVNALMLQKGHHPAPLFGKAAATRAPVTVLKTVPAAAPARAQVDDAAAATEPRPAAAKSRKAAVATRDTDAQGSDDAIGKLLAGGVPAPSAKAKGDGRTDGKIVMGVQRALTKLGFKVPATGTVGPTTRKAIEAFEKDRHMPIKGELNHRLVKVLAAESGIKID